MDYTYPDDEEEEPQIVEPEDPKQRTRTNAKPNKVIEQIMWLQPDKEGFLTKKGKKIFCFKHF